MNPFQIVDNINEKKGLIEDYSDYVPFIVNKAFSFQRENIFYANEMNMNSTLDSDQAYSYYYHSIPKKKRWGKWEKFKLSDDIALLMKYYNTSYKKAFEFQKILSKDQIQAIADSYNKGG